MWKRDRYHVVDEDENLVAVAWNEGLAEQMVANHNALAELNISRDYWFAEMGKAEAKVKELSRTIKELRDQLVAEQHVAKGTIAIGEDQLDAAENSDAPENPPAAESDATAREADGEPVAKYISVCDVCNFHCRLGTVLRGGGPMRCPMMLNKDHQVDWRWDTDGSAAREADGKPVTIIGSGPSCSKWVESFKIEYCLTEQALALASDCSAVDDRLVAAHQRIYKSMFTHVSALGRACAEVATEQPQPKEDVPDG